MSWVKIDDQLPNHPKVARAGPLACWLYVCGLAYSGQYLTDGRIPLGQVRKLADVDNALDLAQVLCDVGLWHQVKDGYVVHDYLDYNPSAEEVKARKEEISKVRSEAGKRGMASRWHSDNKNNNEITNEPSYSYNNDNKPHNKNITPSPSPSPIPHPVPVIDARKKCAPAPTPNASLFFDPFWHEFPARKGRKAGPKDLVRKAFDRLPPSTWPLLVECARNYARYCDDADQYPVDPIRFIKNKMWEEYTSPIEVPPERNKTNGQSRRDQQIEDAARGAFGAGLDEVFGGANGRTPEDNQAGNVRQLPGGRKAG